MTFALHKRLSGGRYFRLAYTYAHAIDNRQDALVAGAPSTVQNSDNTKSERASRVTDQRQRLTVSAIEESNPFAAGQRFLATMFDHWTVSGIMTFGSGRPANEMVSGDPNQDGNTSNDRLSGYGRNAFIGRDYANHGSKGGKEDESGRTLSSGVDRGFVQSVQSRESEVQIDDEGYYNAAGQFIKYTQSVEGAYYPAYYQQPANLMKVTSAYAPRQMQLSMRLNF